MKEHRNPTRPRFLGQLLNPVILLQQELLPRRYHPVSPLEPERRPQPRSSCSCKMALFDDLPAFSDATNPSPTLAVVLWRATTASSAPSTLLRRAHTSRRRTKPSWHRQNSFSGARTRFCTRGLLLAHAPHFRRRRQGLAAAATTFARPPTPSRAAERHFRGHQHLRPPPDDIFGHRNLRAPPNDIFAATITFPLRRTTLTRRASASAELFRDCRPLEGLVLGVSPEPPGTFESPGGPRFGPPGRRRAPRGQRVAPGDQGLAQPGDASCARVHTLSPG